MPDCNPPESGKPYYYRLTLCLVRVDRESGAECDEDWMMTGALGGDVPVLYHRLVSEIEMWDMLARAGYIRAFGEQAVAALPVVEPSRRSPSHDGP